MKAQCLCLDKISRLPSSIIENILCLLPIKEAARTSILSRSWRYNWVTIPKLEFVEKDFKVTTDENPLEEIFESPAERIFYAINQILLVHRGPIEEFALSMDSDDRFPKIGQIILHLSTNNSVKKFTVNLSHLWEYTERVPLSIFSLHQLTHLHLHNCDFDHVSIPFNGFSSLTSLYMDNVSVCTELLIHLISTSPLLKSVTLIVSRRFITERGCTSFNIFKCLPVIEHLSMGLDMLGWFAWSYREFQQEPPTSLVHLKSVCFDCMSFVDKYMLPFLLRLIRSSPNLEKFYLWIYRETEIDSITLPNCSDIWLEHLNELEIENFITGNPEMEFVKLMVAKSPVLKKVRIVLCDKVTKDEELMMLRILLRSPRASPVVDIIVERPVL